MNAELNFPVDAHHRIIIDATCRDDEKVQSIFAGLNLLEPVTVGNVSVGGKYVSYSLSVRIADREEMGRIDAAIKSVPGIKMCL